MKHQHFKFHIKILYTKSFMRHITFEYCGSKGDSQIYDSILSKK